MALPLYNSEIGVYAGATMPAQTPISRSTVSLFLFFFHADDFAAFIVSTIWADGMRQAHLATIAAGYQVERFQSIVGAAAITTSFGQFPFWLWGHGLTPVLLLR